MPPTLPRFLTAFFATVIPVFSAPVINEFLANNTGGLADADGNHPDWIEIYNPDSVAVNLEGYTLTDDPEQPALWTFPQVSLAPLGFLLVFASEKDRLGGEWHTNFRLGETGYLALSDTSGTVLSSFTPTYPNQFENVSYGVAQDGTRTSFTLIESTSTSKVLVPNIDQGTAWTGIDFDDASWISGTTGVGYEAGNGYQTLFGQGGDLQAALFGNTTSLYLRVPFQVTDLTQLSELNLRIKYDDGFVAWINGVRVASDNAPNSPRWNSEATQNHDDGSAVQFQDFDASAAIPRLRVGTNILAIQGLNVSNDSSDMLILPELEAVRVAEVVSGETGYMERPSPGALNGASFGGFLGDTKFNVDRGFHDTPFDLEITTETEGAEIRYTTNGNAPTATTGTVYTSPIRISRSLTLRAAAFKPGLVPTNVDTVTYLFLNDVVNQSANGNPPAGWPGDGAIGGQSMNYGMDPDIVNGTHTPSEVRHGLQAVPTLSITTDIANLVSATQGIYVNPGNDGRNWERPASIELLNPDGTKGFQIDAGLRIRGGFSRSTGNPKHSFRLFFRREYGEGKLRYPMFGDEGADAFDNLDLRTSQNYSWAFGGDSRNTMLRDVWSRDMQGRMGHPYTRSRYYHLYLNGNYWGLYQTQERSEASFAETYMGGNKEDFDVIKSFGNVTDGTRDAHSRLWREATSGFASDARYWHVQGLNPDGSRNATLERLLDVDNLIDYMILTYYTGDRDGPGSRFTQPSPNNFYTIYNRAEPDGFKYFEHDSEHSLGTGDNDMTFPFTTGTQETNFNPHWLHERLVANANYRQRFADLVYKHLFNGGFLSPNEALAAVDHRAAQIDQAIIAESARWGDAQRATPYTRDAWLNAVQDLKQWIRSRRETLLGQLKGHGWISQTDPPEFSPPPSPVPVGTQLLFRASGGNVSYTLDGSDPLQSADVLTAVPAGEQITVLVQEGASAKATVPSNSSLGNSWHNVGFNDASWASGTTAVGYDEQATYRTLIGLDVDATMNDTNTSVYVRIPFTVTDPNSLTRLTLKMKYDDGFAAFLNGTQVVAANSPATLSWNASATAGHADNEATQFVSFDLTDALPSLQVGANILAIHGLNDSLSSSDMLVSPQLEGSRSTGGTAITLPEGRVTLKARIRSGNEWSTLSEGTFLVGGESATSENIVISEIMYHPAPPNEAEKIAGFSAGDFEYLELLNIGSIPVDLSDLFFLRGLTFRFPGNTLLDSNARGLLVSNAEAFAMRYGNDALILGTFSGSLDDGGERIALARTWDNPIKDLRFNDKAEWPTSADGTGRSLVLIDPSENPDPTAATSWLASLAPLGAPGAADPGTTEDAIPNPEPISPYDSWKERWEIVDDKADPDQDGLTHLLEYAMGFQPLESDAESAITITRNGSNQVILEHARNPNAVDVNFTIESSMDLELWNLIDLQAEPIENETVLRYRLPNQAGIYVRVRATR